MADANQTLARVYFFDLNHLLSIVGLPADTFDGLKAVVEQNLPSGCAVDSYWNVDEQKQMLNGSLYIVGASNQAEMNWLPTTSYPVLYSIPASYKMGVRVKRTA